MELVDQLEKLRLVLIKYGIIFTKNEDDAKDLAMDVITKLIEKSDELSDVFNDYINLERYARRALKNRFLDLKRQNVRFVNTTSLDTEERVFLDTVKDDYADLNTTAGLERRDLVRALAAVGEECQEILALFGFGNSYKEIAEELDTAIGTVMSRMSRCRSKLLSQLEDTSNAT